MVLRLSEHYTSVQGEGPRVGYPTQFVRFAGCNLRCAGWPCDTPHAIFPEKYRNEWEKITPEDLVERIDEQYRVTGATRICLTGAEPLLQPNKDLEELQFAFWKRDYQVEVFSNGTLPYPDWAPRIWNFIMDWKLGGSGEGAIAHDIRWKNLHLLSESHRWSDTAYQQAVKFVMKDELDFEEARLVYNDMTREGISIPTFYGRVWDSEWTDADMIKLVLEHKLPWRLNIQTHQYIWPPNERRR